MTLIVTSAMLKMSVIMTRVDSGDAVLLSNRTASSILIGAEVGSRLRWCWIAKIVEIGRWRLSAEKFLSAAHVKPTDRQTDRQCARRAVARDAIS